MAEHQLQDIHPTLSHQTSSSSTRPSLSLQSSIPPDQTSQMSSTTSSTKIPSMESTHPPPEIRVVTLNCWGLKYISKQRTDRLTEIGRRLATASPVPNIVALQECWCRDDYRTIRRETRLILPYGKFYHAGAFGAGLVILSKWPIEESSMYQYPLNGRPTAFWRGDWYVGKGVAHAKIRYGSGQKDILEVFNTHTHAPYEKEPNDSYLCHRTAQAWHIAKLLRGALERNHLVIGAGDFNMLPQSLAHRIITTCAPMHDAWLTLHPDSALGPANHASERARRRPIPTADFNVRENGVTSNSVFNTWRWPKQQRKLLGEGKDPIIIPPDSIDREGQRLDYIFFNSNEEWTVKDVNVGMIDRHPRLGCTLSDHFSVEATLTLSPNPNPNPKTPLPPTLYDEILSQTQSYTTREHTQRKYRAYHFYVSVLATIASLVAQFFVPSGYPSFLLALVPTLGLTSGIIDGLLALLFFGSEIRALEEFAWEVRNAKDGDQLGFSEGAKEDS